MRPASVHCRCSRMARYPRCWRFGSFLLWIVLRRLGRTEPKAATAVVSCALGAVLGDVGRFRRTQAFTTIMSLICCRSIWMAIGVALTALRKTERGSVPVRFVFAGLSPLVTIAFIACTMDYNLAKAYVRSLHSSITGLRCAQTRIQSCAGRVWRNQRPNLKRAGTRATAIR